MNTIKKIIFTVSILLISSCYQKEYKPINLLERHINLVNDGWEIYETPDADGLYFELDQMQFDEGTAGMYEFKYNGNKKEFEVSSTDTIDKSIVGLGLVNTKDEILIIKYKKSK